VKKMLIQYWRRRMSCKIQLKGARKPESKWEKKLIEVVYKEETNRVVVITAVDKTR